MAFVNILILLACMCFTSADQPFDNGMLKSKLLRGESLDLQQQYRSSTNGRTNSSKGKLGAFGAGCALWCLLPCILWQNERIAIKQAKLQGKASRGCIIIDSADRKPIDLLEGRIVFVTGISKCDEKLQDKLFASVTAANCVKLRRIVEMRQWVETEVEEEIDGRKSLTYTYRMEWRDTEKKIEHDSNGQHTNPPMPIPSTQRDASGYRLGTELADGEGEPCAEVSPAAVKFGAYYCGDFVRREFNNWIPVELTQEKLNLPRSSPLKKDYSDPTKDGENWWNFKLKQAPRDGQSDLGTVRVKFEELQCGSLSVCGVLAHTDPGWTFVPIVREDGSLNDTIYSEFGLTCCNGEHVHFKEEAKADEDKELKIHCEKVDKELYLSEMTQFRELKDENEKTQTFYNKAEPPPMVAMLHKFGIEEEFLGVKEKNEDVNGMMKEEADNAFRRHCIVRVAGLVLGVMASLLILSPFTNWLTSSWLIYLLGGGLLSCILQLAACLCSLTVVTTIIAVAWVRHRWRMSLFLLLVIGAAFAGMHQLAKMNSEGTCGSFPGVCPMGYVAMDVSALCTSVPCSNTDCCSQSSPAAAPAAPPLAGTRLL